MPAQHQEIRIVPASLEHAESFCECLDSVARERKWLAITQTFPADDMRQFMIKNQTEGSPTFFALLGERVVGWADCRWAERETIRHRRILGMGVHTDFRGQGIGTRLLQALIVAAKANGIMRLDLTVYASNTAALALYRKLGFTEEGRIVKGRYLDGRFDDVIQMGLIFPENLPTQP